MESSLHGCNSSGWFCSSLHSHMSCREITAPPWSPWAVPVPEYLFPLLWTLCSQDYFSLFSLVYAVFTLPWIDSPRAATSLAGGCIEFCVVSAGTSCVQHEAAVGISSPGSPAGPPLPASRHGWTQAPRTSAFHWTGTYLIPLYFPVVSYFAFLWFFSLFFIFLCGNDQTEWICWKPGTRTFCIVSRHKNILYSKWDWSHAL